MFNKLTAIIRKDTALRFEGRSELLFFLILPLIFTFLVGGGLPAAAGNAGDNRLLLPLVDEDGSARSVALLTALAAGDVARPEAMSRAEAEALLAGEDAAAALIIPAGFGAALLAEGLAAGQEAAVTLLVSPTSNAGPAIEGEVNRAIGALARPLLVARKATEGVAAVRPFADETARAAFFAEALAAAEAETAPPTRVAFQVAAGNNGYDQRAQASAGQLITWVFIPLLGASGLFVYERLLGTLRRLMVTPTRKSTFLLGAIGGQYGMALLQMALLVLFGVLVMRVPWARDPAALVVVLAAFGLAGVALGTALGTFVKTEGQSSNLSIMLGMAMALLGGCWWPMELFPTGMQKVVKVLPTTWAMSAMTDITMRGHGLADILPEAGVLLAFAAVFFVVGLWRFRYE